MIKHIKVTNFRSLRNFELDLGKNNVIVGPNNSGKSNLIDFFRFLRDLIVPSPQNTYGLYSGLTSRGGFNQIAWRGGDLSEITIQLDGVVPRHQNDDLSWRYTLEILGNFQWNSATIKSENLLITSKDQEFYCIKTEGEKRLVFGEDNRQISGAFDNSRLALESYYQDWIGNQIRNVILSWRFYDLVPALMKQPNPTAAPASLNAYGDNLSAWLMLLQTRYATCFEKIKVAALDAFPAVTDLFSTPTEQSQVFLSSTEQGLNRPITVGSMSDGELAYIALLSLIYAPKELGGAMYLIEEPENHLHPRLLSVLVDLLHQRQAELGNDAGQIVLTTHSLQLIDQFSLDDLVVLKKVEGATSALRPRDAKDLRDILASKEVGLGELYYSGALNLA